MPRFLECTHCGQKAVSYRDKPDLKVRAELEAAKLRIETLENALMGVLGWKKDPKAAVVACEVHQKLTGKQNA